ASVDPGGAAQSFSSLPLDYFAPGMGYLYARTNWSTTATEAFVQMGSGSGVGHAHDEAGTFQLWSGGAWLSKESTGYSGSTLTGFNGSGSVDVSSVFAHNGISLGGQGENGSGGPKVTRVQSGADYTFYSVDLSGVYSGGQ